MSLVLSISALLLILCGNGALLYQLRRLRAWSQRRAVQLAILVMPTLLLILNLCMLSIISWHFSSTLLFFVGITGIAGSAVVLAFLRLLLLAWTMKRHTPVYSSTLQQRVKHITQQGPIIVPRTPLVRVVPCQKPLALTYGFRQPIIVLSSWMVSNLDERELEAVLAHELTHVSRHDALVMWLAEMLRDAFFYLPTSWLAYRQLQQEKELACDELAATHTHRPLALAGALTKVWLQTLGSSAGVSSSLVQPLLQAKVAIQERIERLLAFSPSELSTNQGEQYGSPSIMQILLTIGAMYGSYCLLMLIAMNCAPSTILQRFL